MKKYQSKEMCKAYEKAGFRERYAMEKGNKSTIYVNGQKCLKFTYSNSLEYQDANGAIYNTVIGQWIS